MKAMRHDTISGEVTIVTWEAAVGRLANTYTAAGAEQLLRDATALRPIHTPYAAYWPYREEK